MMLKGLVYEMIKESRKCAVYYEFHGVHSVIPQCWNEYTPVAFNSLIMKTFERVVKDKLLTMVQDN